MAIGDDATAAGIPIMTGNEQANTLDTEINFTRDEIARRGRRAVTPVTEGGTGATTTAAARAALGAQAALGYTPARVDGPNMARFQWDGGPGRMLNPTQGGAYCARRYVLPGELAIVEQLGRTVLTIPQADLDLLPKIAGSR